MKKNFNLKHSQEYINSMDIKHNNILLKTKAL